MESIKINLSLILTEIDNNFPLLTKNVIMMIFLKDFINEGIRPTKVKEDDMISILFFQKINRYLECNYKLLLSI